MPAEQNFKLVVAICCMVYGLLFALVLSMFVYYSNKLVVKNITSNENLRGKWNAKYDQKQNEQEKEQPGFCEKMKYFYCQAQPKSRVALYHKYLARQLD